MSILNLSNPGNQYEGRIERLQIMRSDGTIRESKKVNIHNTIVDTGLDNLLTVGGFDAGVDYNSRTMNFNGDSYGGRRLHYDMGILIRMLWYMCIGTDSEYNVTTYDMTNLVSPYANDNGEQYSPSHYIPSSADLSIRGTTDESMVAGDIHSTHRITSNSVKASEDGVVITEVGFFVGVNKTYSDDIDFPNQVYTPGDMFSRISLGEAHKVTLNKGERLVVTYALTEYAGASTHQSVNDINLVDANGDPIRYKDSDGNWHTYGAISRCWMCDGKRSSYSQTNEPLPGAFRGIHPTSAYPCCVGSSSIVTTVIYNPSVYVNYTYYRTYPSSDNSYSSGCKFSRYYNWNGGNYPYVYSYPVMVARQAKIYTETGKSGAAFYYNQPDAYGFPGINAVTQYYGSAICNWMNSDNAAYTHGAGRCNNNTTNPTPTGWYSGSNQSANTAPIIDTYYRCSTSNNKPATRSQTYTIPTYHPVYCWGGAPSPTSTVGIWWLFVRGMIYKLGYYPDGKAGVLDEFVAAPITKKAGQVMRIKFSETVSRYTATGA